MITSLSNKTFKLYKSLKLKKYRDQHHLFLVYGTHMIDKAKQKDVILEIITSNPNKEGTLYHEDLIKELQQTETFIDHIAICKKEQHPQKSHKILMLDDIQDPDNVGALFRSAAAFGFTHVILSMQSADLYNEKVIRASKGAIFDCYAERKPLIPSILDLKKEGYQVVYADAHDKGEAFYNDKVILILGNEGHGIHDDIKKISDRAIHIPTKHVESLNVSVAGAILMYEWSKI